MNRIIRPRITATITLIPTVHGMPTYELTKPNSKKLKDFTFMILGSNDALTCIRCKHLLGLIFTAELKIIRNPNGWGRGKWEGNRQLQGTLDGQGVHSRCRHWAVQMPKADKEAVINTPLDKPMPAISKPFNNKLEFTLQEVSEGKIDRLVSNLEAIRNTIRTENKAIVSNVLGVSDAEIVETVKETIEDAIKDNEDDTAVFGLRFDERKIKTGEVLPNSKDNFNRDDARDFPVFGTKEYDELDTLDGTSAYSLPVDDDNKLTEEAIENLNRYVKTKDLFSDTTMSLVMGEESETEGEDDDEIIIADAKVVSVLFYKK